ncbi:MAG: hypothetical protein ACYC1L_06185 [Alphaproteobacteria bacterium]
MAWQRYFVLRLGGEWFVVHGGVKSGAFPDADTAARFAVERARVAGDRDADASIVLMQDRTCMLREVWSSAAPRTLRYESAWFS